MDAIVSLHSATLPVNSLAPRPMGDIVIFNHVSAFSFGRTGSPYTLRTAILGISCLVGTPFEEIGHMFIKSQSSSAAGCG